MFVWQGILKILILIFLNAFSEVNRTQAAVTLPAVGKFNCSLPPNLEDFNIGKCCRLPAINLGPAVEKCHQQIKSFKTYNDKYPAYAHVCYPECIYRETKSLRDNDGVMELENVEKFLKANVKKHDENIVPTIVQSFQSCLNNIHQHMQAQGIQAFQKLPELGCSPYASMVYSCVNVEVFLNCPSEMWQQNEHSCNLARSFAQQCNPLPHIPLPMI